MAMRDKDAWNQQSATPVADMILSRGCYISVSYFY